jgi:hypothetical protein
MFLNRAAYRSSSLFASLALLTYCAVCAAATAQVGLGSDPVHLLALQQTKYRLRAGEAVPVAAPRETLDFIRNARNRVARVSGVSEDGFVLGPSARGDQVVLAASLAMKPGEYTVSLSAVSETGEERVMTLNVTLDPMQTASLPAEIVSTQALIAQGWVVPGAFEPIPPALQAEVESQLVLGSNYDSLDAAVSDKRVGAR